MADLLHFSRDTKVYLVQETGSIVWEIPVLDGFSFSQATNATEITLNEMSDAAGTSRRARQMFTDSYAPAEWSFSTYMRPNNGTSVEEALWANFVTDNTFTRTGVTTAGTWADSVTYSAPNTTYDFLGSNKVTLGTYSLYFVMGACTATLATPGIYAAATDAVTIYKISGCVGNSASIDFDIDGIAMINWSGFGSIITEEPTFDFNSVPGTTPLIDVGVSSTANFIRNRLTSLTVTAADTATFPGAAADGVYNVVLTGGNITFENNITFLTPETLCAVNQPIGHVTGTRAISGNFTCYLNSGIVGGSADLFEDIIEATSVVTNDFELVFSIGGSAAPLVSVTMPNCHLEVPTHSLDDVISVETNFHALPTTVDVADEATIVYTGTA